jgi:hypothetical protein
MAEHANGATAGVEEEELVRVGHFAGFVAERGPHRITAQFWGTWIYVRWCVKCKTNPWVVVNKVFLLARGFHNQRMGVA